MLARTPLGQSVAGWVEQVEARLGARPDGQEGLRRLVPLGFVALATRDVLTGRLDAIPRYALLWFVYEAVARRRSASAASPRE